jgi:VRR-NUC domain
MITRMPTIDLSRSLPSKYYLCHFTVLINDLLPLYGHWLSAEEHEYLQALSQLPEPALCLYLRLINRKGVCFNPLQLNYPELGKVDDAGEPLIDQGFMTCPPTDATAAMAAWDAPLLKALAGAFLVEAGYRCHSKKRLLAGLQASPYLPDMLTHGLRYFGPLWQVQYKPLWQWLLFLYFGQPEHNLSRFALHDMRLNRPDGPDQLTPLFEDRQDAERAFYWHHKPLAVDEDIPTLIALPYGPAAETVRHRHLMQTAAQLEKQTRWDEAIALYQAIPQGTARIRHLKLLKKTGRLSEALTVAAQRNTQAVEEALYVERLLVRHKKATNTVVVPEQHVLLTPPDGVTIERHVLSHLASQGWQGLHAENWLWRSLFGLTFWDELHHNGVYHHRLQVASRDLRHGKQFWLNRQKALEQRLNLLSDPVTWYALLAMTHWRHQGKPDALVNWSPQVLPTLQVWLNQLPLVGIKAVLLLMAQHIDSLTCGLPDLFIWRHEQCAFVEVKSPNDRLSILQTHWIRFFQQHELPVWVLKVRYTQVA